MTALPILETHDVRRDVGRGFLAGLVILEMNMFAFEGAKETLYWGTVIAIACAAHADSHLLVSEKLLVGFSGILAAPVRMMKQSIEHEPILDRHTEGLFHEATLQGGCKGPADNFAKEQIQDYSRRQPAFRGYFEASNTCCSYTRPLTQNRERPSP